ncbi:MAG: DegQ family serine endoprotease [Gammaproteobacteria bacterium]|nr:DegQ family serine endoprotease [Gammaproteobacteria bacterium]
MRSFVMISLLLGQLTLGRFAIAVMPVKVGDEELPSLAPMLERVTPAVVNIATEGRVIIQNPLLSDPFFRRFFNLPDEPTERKIQSLGSGVIVDTTQGYVLTNNHVIQDALEITVTLRDGRRLQAELVGTDPETDVAVIKIPAKDLKALPTADSDKLRVGDFVVAIGNPFRLGQTVTSGIISALGRSGLGIEGYEDFIQTDASINPGNSGGALVNLRGELVGINTAIFSPTGGNIGIGFAIPINMARNIMEQLVEYGQVQRGFVGITLQDVDADLAEAFHLPDAHGAVVVGVTPGSPAEQAGLKAGDIITAINGDRIRSSAEVRNEIGLLRVGDKLQFDLIRNGKSVQISTVMSPKEADLAKGPLRNPRLGGATFAELEPNAPGDGDVGGVQVFNVEQGSRAWQNGLRPGDIITSVNRTPVRDMRNFLAAVNNERGNLLLRIRRGNSAAYIVAK